MAEDGAELVGLHLAEIGTPAAERRDASRRVAGRSAGDFDRLAHIGIEHLRPFFVDEVHRSFDQAVALDEPVIDPRDDIHDGIADTQDVKIRLGHGNSCSNNQCH